MLERGIALTNDGSLVLDVERSLYDAVLPWIPRHRGTASEFAAGAAGDESFATLPPSAVIRVCESLPLPGGTAAEARPTLTLGGVAAFVGDARAVLRTPCSTLRGDVDLDARTAAIALGSGAPSSAEMHGSITLAAALLLGRMGRALVHAAAVVDPSSRGWLIVGDSHSGKTTTCATLIAAGWRYAADDQVVIAESSAGDVIAEGWPREAHLDRGWSRGAIAGARDATSLDTLRRDAWIAGSALRGAWFTSIDAARPTELLGLSKADALAKLIRQSPWLLADRFAARSSLALLTRVVSSGCWELRLGRDSYARPEVLAAVVSAASE